MPDRLVPWIRPPLDLLRRSATSIRRRVYRLHPRRVVATVEWGLGVLGQIRRRRSESGLSVGVDADALWDRLTGVGWYLHYLLEHVETTGLRVRLYGPALVDSAESPEATAPLRLRPGIEVVRYPVPDDLSLPPHWLSRILRWSSPLLITLDGNRVLFAPNFVLPRRMSWARGRLCSVIHDLTVLRFPDAMEEENLRRLTRRLHRGLRRSRQIITPSRAVRDEVVARGLAPESRVTAIHHGSNHLREVREPLTSETESISLPPRFVLHVGTLEPRKNLQTLLTAYQRVHRRLPPLLLCGALGWKSDDLAESIERARDEGWLVRPGYLTRRQLQEAYSKADLVAFPSIYEGFGLPLVEAMSWGAPLLVSDIPVFREVAGSAAAFVDAEDTDAWAQALVRLHDDDAERDELRRRGEQRAADFDWVKTACETVAAWTRTGR